MHAAKLALSVGMLVGLTNAQDFIHYKFDSACTSEVINYATGAAALPMNGVLQTNSASSPFAPGVWGKALAGSSAASTYNRVITGWDPGTQNITGDFTMAWFMKERIPPSTLSLGYMMGAPSGGVRLLTNGVAGRGLYQRLILAGGGNGVNASILNDFYLPQANADIQTLAATAWIHVAIVVNATAQTADWFVNGTSVLQLTNVPGALINMPGAFQVGFYSSESPYDIDEFLISLRAYTPGEILALSLAPRAGDGPFTSGITQCSTAKLGSAGGRPSLGNVGYSLTLNSSIIGPYALLIGTNRCTTGGGLLQLPRDLSNLGQFATGCWLLTDSLATIGGTAIGVPVTSPLPIPSNSALGGLDLYIQGLLLNLSANQMAPTLGWAMGLGF